MRTGQLDGQYNRNGGEEDMLRSKMAMYDEEAGHTGMLEVGEWMVGKVFLGKMAILWLGGETLI